MKLELVEPAETTAALGTAVSYGNAGQYVACPSTSRNHAVWLSALGHAAWVGGWSAKAFLYLSIKLKLVEPAETIAAMRTEVTSGNSGEYVAC